ncbi:ABC transporter permease [Pararhizobium polonicum]|uniref:ABC transporter permease n=1 Tax=Pararhizobium polonicum TaxID=1612624 RepID=UPI001313DEE2|nr:ABC transporter permease [Pararhizobium polonicum]
MLGDPLALFGVIVLILVLIAALFPEFLATHKVSAPSRDRLVAPSMLHFMGTDQFGRDVFSRIAHGARTSVLVGLGTVSLALAIGVPLGAVAGFRPGSLIDNIIMRVMDVMLAFPAIVLAIAVIGTLGTRPIEIGPITIPHIAKLMIVIGLLSVPQIARLVRAAVLIERQEQYVLAERALGASGMRILFRDVMRNCISPIVVYSTTMVADAIIAEASLGFLGLGIQPPLPSWGGMLSDAKTYVFSSEWWLTLCPGAMIFLTVLSLNLLGDCLRDLLDPRFNGRGQN